MKKLQSILMAFAIGLPGICNSAETQDSLSMRTGMTDWIDPIKAVPEGCEYVIYPSPHRGEVTDASCIVYLPPSYHNDTISRYPVVYYLHGGTGNQREVTWLIHHVDEAIRKGDMNPVIIVSPQALPIGWYVNANTSDPKVISGPIENVLIKDLIPYIDSKYRTMPEERGIEGFSMGGRGALMLAFKHPDIFKAASSVAGAVVNWEEEPLQRALECTFGDVNNEMSKIYFDSWHPLTFACQNRNAIIDSGMKIRMFVGDKDRLYEENGNHITDRFHNRLDSLGIEHKYVIISGANHNPNELFPEGTDTYDVSFWNEVFRHSEKYPEEITQFVEKNFPECGVVEVTNIPDSRGTHYLIRISDGTTIKLNEKFNWIKIEIPESSCIPSWLLLLNIAKYIEDNYSGICKIKTIEKIPRMGYEIYLRNGTVLKFDTKGSLLK